MRQRGGERRAAPSGGMEPRIGVRRERARQRGGSAAQPPPPRRQPGPAPRPSAPELPSLPCRRSANKVGGWGPRGGSAGQEMGGLHLLGWGQGGVGQRDTPVPATSRVLSARPGYLDRPRASGRDAPLGKDFVPVTQRLVLLLRTYLLSLGRSAPPAARGAEHKAQGSLIVQSWDTPGSRRRDRGSSLRFQPCPYFRVYLWVRR